MAAENENKVFLIASSDAAKVEAVSAIIKRHFSDPTIYSANDGPTGLDKIKNAPPRVVIVDSEIPKLSATRFIDVIIHDEAHPDIAVIVLSELPKKEKYLDELATGRVQFVTSIEDEETLFRCLTRALNFSCHNEKAEFSLKFLAPGDHLIREGEKGK